jgi:predicted CXXCH cytochrome family protein
MLRSGGVILALVFGIILLRLGLSPTTVIRAQSSAAPPAVQGPAQPIAFSHKVHAGTVKLPCETCHTLSKSGQSLTMPQAPLCMQCHQTIATDKPEVQKLTALSKGGQPIPWVRIYQTPSFVRFSHKMHLDQKNTCKECHGDVSEQDQLFKATDISMAGCLSCHNLKKANTGCDTCHTLEQSDRRAPQRHWTLQVMDSTPL